LSYERIACDNQLPMNQIIIQIYEVQTPSEAEKLMALGVDHVGSVIVSKASWKVPPIKETIHLIQEEGCRSTLIPLFDDLDAISFMLDYYNPDIVHFCEVVAIENGLSDSCKKHVLIQKSIKKRFPEIKIMRSIPIFQPKNPDNGEPIELARLFEPISDYFLTDTLITDPSGSVSALQPVEGFVGITGQVCNWGTAAKLVQSSHIPVILGGGIGPDNVFNGIMDVMPAGVDSCTGTNAVDSRGRPTRFKKDLLKIRHLIEEVRRAEKMLDTDEH
jgi:phosphoribosylanthranilate isomerase